MSIKIRNMLIDYGNAIAVDDLSMVVETGELASLLGPSGCGKSTTLNAISGLLQVSKGQILFDGVDVTKKSPQRRNIGLVFQNYALYPHLSVFQNIAFPLHQNKNFKRDIKTNNDMLALDIKEIKHANKVIKVNKLLEQSKKVFDFYLREVERSFKKVETNYNTLSKKLNDKYAVEIYGAKELNAFRSRIFIQWYDAWRAFVEQQRVGMYQNLISTFANTVLNNPDMYSSNNEIQKILKFEINIFTSRIALEQLAKSEDKVNGIENAVKSHAKTLIEEVKVSQKLAKLNGKPFVWKVSIEERENLINQRNTEFEQFQNEFLAELNNQLEETFKQLMESNSKFVELILNANDDYLDADNSKITDEQYNNLLADKKKQLTTYKRAVKTAVKEVAEKVEITSQLKKKPSELSGGQQQRVAIARAIVKKPNVLLLDEPLSNLDAKLRVTTREWIKKFQKSTGITTIFVTHDQEEAMSISDKIFIMDKGVLQQTGTPMEIYQKPANRFVANFIGTPSMNFFEEAEINNKGELILAGHKIGLSKELKDMKVTVGIRPEHIDLEASTKKTYVNKKAFTGIIDVLEQLGRTDYIKAKFEGTKDEIRIVYEAQSSTPRKLKESINLYFQSGTIYLFSKENNQELLEVL